MLQHVVIAYHRFAKWTGQTAQSRPLVSLNVVTLEERATPAATPSFVPLIAAPQTVLVAPITAAAPVVGGSSLAIPMAGQSMVRLDLTPPGESPQAEQADETIFARPHQPQPATPPVAPANAEDLAVSEEELAEMLAAHQTRGFVDCPVG
jgi:hypothetical protein